MSDCVSVEFVRRHAERFGAQYNVGESAGLPRAVAEDLIARGVAKPLPAREPKAPERPTLDKMVRAPGRKKIL